MTDNFVNLHNHSDYSLLDGFGTVDEYIARAVELEQPALGLTDHGNVCGLYSFVNKCHKAGIKPIPGIEAYVAPVNPKGAKCHKPIRYGVAGQESIDVSGNGSYLHMTLFAMNKQGMKSLYALVREASEEGNAFSHLPLKEGEGNFYTKPRMDMDMLAAHNAGLIATTGCPSGEIQTRFRLGQDREAYDYATRMAELFDGRYFVEIMDHNMKGNDIERNVLPKLIKLADDLHLPLIATNDAHYCRAEDAPHHEEMLCSNSKAKMTDPTYEQGGNRFAFNGNQYYLKSSADMLTIPVFQEHPEAVENTVKLADMVEDINFELEGDLRPEVKIPDGYDEVSWFKHKIKEGFIKKRVQAGASKEVIRESQKRIAHELPVFTENNFAQYMLVVQDYINWAREHGILVGFGRGCFLPGAKIRAKQGGFTNIENIKIGDKVRTHDATYHTVENVFEYDVKDDDCVEILLSNGMTIKCTADHMLFGDGIGFKKAEDFKAGDIVLGPVENKTDNNEINYELNTYNDSLHETNKSGYFHSYQNDKDIYYASSYELKSLNILETDSTVKSFGRSDDRITYISPDNNNKHYYLPDLEVLYKDGTHSVIEVKAKWQLSEPATIAKINAAKKFYEEKGIKFNVWTEDELQAMNDAWHVKTKILSIKHFKYTGKVYDLQVEGVHNYTVSDITVHNSVGGSEIAYLMNISDTDPIRHNLMFERFLNPERISPPDVDTDFAASRRDEVVDYVKEKYGEDHIANIITFNRFLSKTALNDMARIYGIPIFEVNKADSLMPESKPGTSASFDDIFNEDGKFHSAAKDFIEYVDKPEWKPVIEAARAIEGRIKTTGVHACGLIMSSHPITDAAPFTYKHNPTKPWGSSCCQWTYEELESIGLIKMDFLSLSDLDLVADTIANIKHTHDGKAPDMWELVHGPMDDKPTYDMLSRGETMNVFQLSSEGMQALFKRMQPTCFEDIQASVALYRPGPMGMNAHTQYADRKAGREKDIVINPELDAVFRGSPVDDVLKPTHGLCVPADTMIFDASTGKNVKIKDFIKGHMTKSWNKKTGLTSFNKVSHVIHTGYKDVVRIILSNNESIEISTTHPMFTQRGWVQAKDLKTSDSLASPIKDTKDMPNLRWTNISHIENAGKMDCYDITVDNDHTFFINGFITHNCLYQEEVMNISRFLSGFTWGQADALRKGMGHKKIEVLNEMEPKFIEGAVKNGYPRKETKELWEYLKKFGEYGFNASHAASYGIIAYETAYLKCHYPAEFMAAVLTDKIRKAKSPDDVKNALREVRELGLKVAAIDIDASDVGVSAVKKEKPDDPDIVFGISGIKGVSPSFAEKFVKVRDAWHKEHGRNYASIDEFMRSLPSDLISKRLIEGLAVAGAFDKFGVSRRAVYTVMPEMLEYYKNDAKQKEAGKSSLFDLFDDDEDDDTANANTASNTVSTGFNIPDLPDWDWIHKLEMEEEKLGVFVSGHPLSNIGDGLRFIQIGYAALDDKYGTVITVDDVAKMNITSHDYNGRKYYDSLPVRIIASVADINVRTNKRGSKIIDGRLESERNSIPFRVSKDSMDDVLAKMGTIEAIMKNHVYIISGNITIDWNGNHMMAVDSFDEVMLDRDGRAPIWIHMLARHVRKKDSPGYMKLMRILNNPKNKGDIPVMIHVRNEDKSYGEIDTGCRVSCNDELIMSLEKLIGTNHFGRWSKNINKK